MILLQLFWSFVKIGFTSFGGLSMIPLITSEMLSHRWLTTSQISDIVAIAEMTPGPLGLNCATYAGIKTAGIPGAIAANLGVLMPTLTICVLAAVFFEHFKKSKKMQYVMAGVKPASVGMIAAVIVSLSESNYLSNGTLDLYSIGIGLLDLLLLIKYKISIPKVLLLSALLGILIKILGFG